MIPDTSKVDASTVSLKVSTSTSRPRSRVKLLRIGGWVSATTLEAATASATEMAWIAVPAVSSTAPVPRTRKVLLEFVPKSLKRLM